MTISNNHVLHSKIVLISAYSARNRSDLLLFSQKATPKNWRMERYVVTFCQKRFPSQFPPMYRVETQWWKATAARCPSRWTNTPNQWNPQINERIFQKKNVMSQSPHETEHCKNKKNSGKCNAFVMPQQENVFMSMAIIWSKPHRSHPWFHSGLFFWGRNWHQPSTVGWVPNIDLIEHLLKFQETKPHGPSLGPKLVARVSLSKKVACCSWCD